MKAKHNVAKGENVCKTHPKNVSIYAGYFYVETNEKEIVPFKCKNSAKDVLFEMS